MHVWTNIMEASKKLDPIEVRNDFKEKNIFKKRWPTFSYFPMVKNIK